MQASEEEMAEIEAATKELLDTRGGNFNSSAFETSIDKLSYRQGFGNHPFPCCEET